MAVNGDGRRWLTRGRCGGRRSTRRRSSWGRAESVCCAPTSSPAPPHWGLKAQARLTHRANQVAAKLWHLVNLPPGRMCLRLRARWARWTGRYAG